MIVLVVAAAETDNFRIVRIRRSAAYEWSGVPQ